MAKFKFKVTTNVDTYITAKLYEATPGSIDDDDVGKAVKLYTGAPDMYQLCASAANDQIDGFIVGIDPATADGYALATIQLGGRKRCEADGAMAIGDLVECGTVAAAGTAEANKLPLVATTAVTTFTVNWRVISANTTSGTVADGDTEVIIERL